MILETLEVEGFGCVVKARVELGPGLNVLYGPNDLGKSTLAQAVRAALLLQHKSKEHERFKPWHADLVPTVRLAFVGDDGKHWRVRKTFDYGARGSSVLEWSPCWWRAQPSWRAPPWWSEEPASSPPREGRSRRPGRSACRASPDWRRAADAA